MSKTIAEYPELLEQWDLEKNGNLNPSEVTDDQESSSNIIKKLREEFSFKLDSDSLRKILDGYRKGILWQSPQIRNKIKNRIFQLTNNLISQLDIVEQIRKEFGVILSQITVSRFLQEKA